MKLGTVTVLLMVLARLTIGCASEPVAATNDAEELVATLGPEGGTLEGRAETALEGVRLEVSRGALATPTRVRVVPVVDDTPLAVTAERVGQQYRLEPADVALTAPVRLTLPVDTRAVSDLGMRASDVKVWARAGAAWTVVEAASTVEGRVTIALDRFTVAAAGVRLLTNAVPRCGGSGQPPCAQPVAMLPPPDSLIRREPCTDATGFCIDRIDPSRVPPSGLAVSLGFLVQGSGLYYPVASLSGNLQFRRVVLTTGAVATSTEIQGAGSPHPEARMELEAGNVWTGHGLAGNVRHRFSAPSQRFGIFGEFGCGAVTTQDGTLVRLSDNGFVVHSPVGVGRLLSYPRASSVSSVTFVDSAPQRCHRVAPAREQGNGIWFDPWPISKPRRSGYVTGVLGLRFQGGDVLRFAFITADRSDGGTLRSVELNPDDNRVLVGMACPSCGPPSVRFGTAGGTFAPITGILPAEATDAPVWGSDNAVWARSRDTNELFVVDPNGGITSVLLPFGAAHVRALPDRSVIVLARDGSFLRVRRR